MAKALEASFNGKFLSGPSSHLAESVAKHYAMRNTLDYTYLYYTLNSQSE